MRSSSIRNVLLAWVVSPLGGALVSATQFRRRGSVAGFALALAAGIAVVAFEIVVARFGKRHVFDEIPGRMLWKMLLLHLFVGGIVVRFSSVADRGGEGRHEVRSGAPLLVAFCFGAVVQAIALYLVLVAWAPSIDKVLERYELAGRERLERLRDVVDASRELAGADSPDFAIAVLPIHFARRSEQRDGNARCLWLRAYDRPSEILEPMHPSYSESANWWWKTDPALADDPPDYDWTDLRRLEHDFEELIATEFVLVIQTGEYEAPEHLGETMYQVGSASGHYTLHRLDDGALIARGPFDAPPPPFGSLPFDFTLSSSTPDGNVIQLLERLRKRIHDSAEAHVARDMAEVDSLLVIDETTGEPRLREH